MLKVPLQASHHGCPSTASKSVAFNVPILLTSDIWDASCGDQACKRNGGKERQEHDMNTTKEKRSDLGPSDLSAYSTPRERFGISDAHNLYIFNYCANVVTCQKPRVDSVL
jgi:hypothetical protein